MSVDAVMQLVGGEVGGIVDAGRRLVLKGAGEKGFLERSLGVFVLG